MSDKLKERFSEVFLLITQDTKPVEVASHYGVTENAVRNWLEGKGPTKTKKKAILAEHLIEIDIENLPDDEWQVQLDEISRRKFELKGQKSENSWYFDGEDISEIERNIDSSINVYLITNDVYNICYLPSVFEIMKKNIENGVIYTYITSSNTEKLDLMKKKLIELKNACSGFNCGDVRLFVVPVTENDKEWAFIEHYLLFLKNDGLLGVNTYKKGEMDYRSITAAYSQVYKLGNYLELDKTAWVQLSLERRENLSSIVEYWVSKVGGEWRCELSTFEK